MSKILEYSDVRAFLKDAFDEAKRKNPRWSLRSWALKLKLSGPSGLAMVLNGDRNLGPVLAEKLAAFFKFSATEKDYFLGLARLSVNCEDESKSTLVSVLRSTAESSTTTAAPSREIDIAFRWYFYAIREMSLLAGFVATPEWIGARLRHRVSAAQIRMALETLLSMGYLVRDPAGTLRPAAGQFDAGPGAEKLARRFQAEVLDLGRYALDHDPLDERGFFSSTFTIAAEHLPAAKDAIRRFRIEFEKTFEKKDGTTTIQLNTQIFKIADSTPPRR